MSKSLSGTIVYISKEDFYNYLYWDHRIYDVRSNEDYNKSHICRSHNINPLSIISIDEISKIDKEIDENYGKAENPSEVILYTNNKDHHNYKLEIEILNLLLSYLRSFKNPSNKSLKQINILIDGYQSFYSRFPYLCSDNIYYIECSQLVWPSYITDNLYLGSSICRNDRVISMLNITHIMSFSDYTEKKLNLSKIQTFHCQISDSLSAEMLSVFPSAVKWISKSINDDNGIVLVHCDQGVSRSSTIIIAYLLYSNENFSTVDEALNFVKSKRGIIRPNASFLEQLQQYLINIRMKNDDINT